MQSAEQNDWQGFDGAPWRRYLLATRPMFFTASVLPVILGTAWGYAQAGNLNITGLLLALLTIICVHACINVLNDVYDDINGGDRINTRRIFPYSGGSRFIQAGLLSRSQMFRWAVLLAGIALLLGGILVLREGLALLWLGAAGFGLGVVYSVPPIALANRGLGELAVGIGAGLLPVVGAAWLQTHSWDLPVLLPALPAGIWVACILLINEIPDRSADATCGKRTLVVRLGVTPCLWLYGLLNLAAVAIIAYMTWQAYLPAWAPVLPLALLITMPVLLNLGVDFEQNRNAMTRLIRHTLLIHALGIIWLTAALLL